MYVCRSCKFSSNSECHESTENCPKCHSTLERVKGIEIGHVFLLGSKYSKTLSAIIEKPIEMGCYGIGVTRLLGVLADIFSDEKGLKFPKQLAPYLLNIVPVDDSYKTAAFEVAKIFSQKFDVAFDDREISFGRKMKDSLLVGVPYTAIIGKHHSKGLIELEERVSGKKFTIPVDEVENFFN